jgi:hypothetical protein
MENNTVEISTLPKKGGRKQIENAKSYDPEYVRAKRLEYYYRKKALEEPKEKKEPKGPYIRKRPIPPKLTPEEKVQRQKEYKAKYYKDIYKQKLTVKPEDRKPLGAKKNTQRKPIHGLIKKKLNNIRMNII